MTISRVSNKSKYDGGVGGYFSTQELLYEFTPSKCPPVLSLYQNETSCSLLEQRKSQDQFALLK